VIRPGITRRRLLESAAGAAAGLAFGRIDLALATGSSAAPQLGIATPPLPSLAFGAFDVASGGRDELRELLRTWSAELARLSSTEEATLTMGFGPSLFDGRFGLARARPASLVHLPAFATDALQPERSGGDLALQVCARDTEAATAMLDSIAALGAGAVVARWRQLGFGRAAGTTRRRRTPRNLMGFKDGTDNIDIGDRRSLERFVWTRAPGWLRGGSYMVVRRIRMRLDKWQSSTLDEQQRTIGRFKSSGAPLSGKHEFDRPDLSAGDMHGRPLIPAHAHIRLAAPVVNGGIRILRRGYSYDDGVGANGMRDAGLFFISFQRDPEHFIALQQRLALHHDALNEYVSHTSSAVFACPPTAAPGGYIGEMLFA
jgi:deferrochelatase/peroxidase EfeB